MTEKELARGAARRLAIIRHAEEVTGNVAGTCRYYGITRQAYYTWLRRFEEGGLDALRDRSRRPYASPNATNAEVVGKIVYLRQHYHFGPHKIAMYLKSYHDIEISPSGVWRILKSLDMNRPPTSRRSAGDPVASWSAKSSSSISSPVGDCPRDGWLVPGRGPKAQLHRRPHGLFANPPPNGTRNRLDLTRMRRGGLDFSRPETGPLNLEARGDE